MAEKYTWECLWQKSCGDCTVATYVIENKLGNVQQEKLLGLATAAGHLLSAGSSREEAIEWIKDQPHDTQLPDDAAVVAVDGYIQWSDQRCRETIRATEIA